MTSPRSVTSSFLTETVTKDDRVERQGELLLERRVKSDSLLGRSISVDDRLFNQFVETARRQPAATPRP